MNYKDFIDNKAYSIQKDSQVEFTPSDSLFPFQNHIVEKALYLKRYAVFADCGLGKTRIQLHWAHLIHKKTNKPVLILAPLAVSYQTKEEGVRIGLDINICNTSDDIINGINITNYEKLHHFKGIAFSGVVLDESSILKNFGGKRKTELIENFQDTEYRLCCTATAAPNDLVEIVNHSEFLGYMKEKEAKAMFFIQDGNNTQKWRLKGHSHQDFWSYVSSWSVALRNPSDIGFKSDDYKLPELWVNQIKVASTKILNEGYLLPLEAHTLTERRQSRVNSVEERLQKVVDLLANYPHESWIIWCDYNVESEMLQKAIPYAKEIRGGDLLEKKETILQSFAEGETKVLITKPSIAGFGLNWQHCNRVIFFDLSDSYERFYQAVRRCWRYGQKRDVNVYVVTSDTDNTTVRNIDRKEKESALLYDNIIKNLNQYKGSKRMSTDRIESTKGTDWELYNGDCINAIDQVEDESIGLSIFSPPFPAMYAYTDSPEDMGNSKGIDELLEHFKYLITKDKLQRIIKPGRNVVIHLTQTPAFKSKDGYIGLKDFRGQVIEMMIKAGWIYYSEVAINKNPQVKAQRTKDSTLTFKGLATDSAQCRPAMADYCLIFKKKGDNQDPVKSGNTPRYRNDKGWVTDQDWIEWAHPIWNNIKETNVLNVRSAREDKDERHLCPLQLDVIKRFVLLYTNPGEQVFSPFAGIGSEGYESLKYDRKFVGIELKKSYFDQACSNMDAINKTKKESLLF